MESLDEWFREETVVPENHPIEFRTAIISQNRIGWRHWFMGKVSVDWLRIYGMMTSKADRDETDEELWGRKVVEYTVRHIMEVWESRNKDVHGETNTSPVRRARLQEEIRSLHLL